MMEDFKINLNMLRALADAQVITLEKQGDSDELFRAQVVAKILEDDACFSQMQLTEIVDVLVALGFKSDAARMQAENLYQQAHISK